MKWLSRMSTVACRAPDVAVGRTTGSVGVGTAGVGVLMEVGGTAACVGCRASVGVGGTSEPPVAQPVIARQSAANASFLT